MIIKLILLKPGKVNVMFLAYTIIAKYDYQFRYANLYDQTDDAYTSMGSLEFGLVPLPPDPTC